MAEVYEKDPDDKGMGETALANMWLDRVLAAEKHWEDLWFKRLRENQHYARHGCSPDWMADKEDIPYRVNLVLRHLMNTTAAHYAKNPTPEVVLRRRLDYLFWDGSQEMRLTAQNNMMLAQMQKKPVGEETQLIIQDIQEADEEKLRLMRYGRTIELVLQNAMDVNDFRERLRFQVFRSNVGSVAFVKYGYQREYGILADKDNQLADVRQRLALLGTLRTQVEEGEIFDGDADYARLQVLERRLVEEREYIIREGLVVFFPRTENIIVDPDVQNFRGFIGATWMAEKMEMTEEEIEAVYQIDMRAHRSSPARVKGQSDLVAENNKDLHEDEKHAVYEIYDRTTNTKMVVMDGYSGFLEDPTEPPVEVEDTFPYVAIVLKDSDDPDNPVPPSEVDMIRDMQDDYNAARQAYREHRYVNRPRWLAEQGAINDEDLDRVVNVGPMQVVQVAVQQGKKLSDVLMARPTQPLDYELYSEAPMVADITRATGAPESAWASGSSSTTATEATIANDVRSGTDWATSDRMDMFLSDLMNRMARVAIREMSEAKVKAVAGAGARWPQDPEAKAQVLDRLQFNIKAGSSGKPQKSHELAKLERVAPLLMQIPGVDPTRLAAAILDTLDSSYNVNDFLSPGQPSIMAQNAAGANGGGAMNAPAPAAPEGGRSFVSNAQNNGARAL